MHTVHAKVEKKTTHTRMKSRIWQLTSSGGLLPLTCIESLGAYNYWYLSVDLSPSKRVPNRFFRTYLHSYPLFQSFYNYWWHLKESWMSSYQVKVKFVCKWRVLPTKSDGQFYSRQSYGIGTTIWTRCNNSPRRYKDPLFEDEMSCKCPSIALKKNA